MTRSGPLLLLGAGDPGPKSLLARMRTAWPDLSVEVCDGWKTADERLQQALPALVVADFSTSCIPEETLRELVERWARLVDFIVAGGPDTASAAAAFLKAGAKDYFSVEQEIEFLSWIHTWQQQVEVTPSRPGNAPALVDVPERFNLLLQHLSGSPFQADATLRWSLLTDSWSEITGYPLRECLGKPLLESVFPEDQSLARQFLDSLLQRQVEFSRREIRMGMKDGGFRWIEFQAVALDGVGEKAGGIIGVMRDVTEQRLEQEALRRSEVQYQTLLEQVPAVVYKASVVSGAGDYYVSPQIEGLTGYTAGEWRRTPDLWRHCLHSEDRERVLARVEDAGRTGMGFREEYRLITRDGGVRWVIDECRFMLDEWGRPFLRQGLLIDVTERKRAESSQRRQESLMQAVRAATDVLLRAVNWEDSMAHALEILGLEVGASRTCLCSCQNNREGLSVPHEKLAWSADAQGAAAPGIWGSAQPFRALGLSRVEERLRKGQPFFGRVSDLPEGERQQLERAGILSLALMPVQVRGYLWGFLAFHDGMEARDWTAVELQALRVAAEQFGAGLQRKQMEDALRESEHRLELGLWGGDLGLWDWDLVGHRLAFSERFAEILGLPGGERELGVGDLERMLHIDDAPRLFLAMHEHVEGRLPHCECELRVRLPAGGWKWVLLRGKVVARDELGRALRATGTALDVDDRKQAELLRLQREAFLNSIYSGVETGIAVVDVNGDTCTLAGLNPTWERFLGVQSAAFIGRPLAILETQLRPLGGWRLAGECRRMVEAGEAIEYEEKYTVGGRDGWWLTRVTPLRDAEGGVFRIIALSHNITERKRAEEERRNFEVQIQQTQKLESLGLLAGGIAHDFNNLLTVVHGFADLVLFQLPKDSALRQPMDKIAETVMRMSDLTNQMLAYSGRGKFVIKQIDLNAFVKETTDFFRISISKRAKLEFRLAAQAPQIEADHTQTRQVLLNLITNASEALNGEAGTITIGTGSVRLTREDVRDIPWRDELPEGSYSYLEVTDTGCGMSEDTVRRIFEPFYTTKATGRGLGLSAVQGIVRAHKGFLRIRSGLGQGTTFRVLYPAVVVQQAVALQAVVAAPDEPSQGGLILVVDDEESLQNVVVNFLTALGYEAVSALDGQQALELYRARGREVAAVLLDLTMPKLSGEDVFRELQRMNPEVKVILMSGYHESEATKHFSGKGLAGFISKPFKMRALAEKLRAIQRASEEKAIVARV